MSERPTTRTPEELHELGARHLWMHFSRMGNYAGAGQGGTEQLKVMERGEGCYLYDGDGKRYLDGLSGLFTVNAGHGRPELAAAAAAQASQLAYFPIWGYAHPPAIELAARLAELSPGDLNRVFFTTSGSEAVETAWKLARQYFQAIGEHRRYKVISRNVAYHGTSLGALAITGVASLRTPFEPLAPGGRHVPNTNRYRPFTGGVVGEGGMSEEEFGRVAADAIEQCILMEGPESVAAVFLEPLQNAGGCFTPPAGYFARVREICDRYGVLLVSDEVICAYGRLGHMFGADRYGYVPDIITSAKGLTSGYSPLGAVLVSDRIMEPFLTGEASFAHGITFGGHPVSCAVALANLDLFERDDLCGHVLAHQDEFRTTLEHLRDIGIVGDVRGDGYFWAIELVRDQATRETFTHQEAEDLLRGYLSPRLFDDGLICRADDRGEPVLQFSPPLTAGPEEFDLIGKVLRGALSDAAARL